MTEPVMLVLGGFAFSLSKDTPYVTLRRQLNSGFKVVPRLANFPAHQIMSLPAEKITINGTWYLPNVNKHISDLRKAIYTGQPLLLSDSLGNNLGEYVLISYDENQKSLLSDGNAQEVGFTVVLERYDG